MTRPESSLRFGTAAGGRRSEDGPLLTGRGRFTDDVAVPGQAHAVFVRSSVAHGEDPAAWTPAGRSPCPASSRS